MAIVPFIAHGETYFKDGMKWTAQYVGTHTPGGVYSTQTVSLEGAAAVDGYNALKMFVLTNDDAATKKQVASVRTEDERVYFYDTQSKSWHLMYDFGLEVGEGCYVYNILSRDSDAMPQRTYVKCTAHTENDTYDGWPSLILAEYESEVCDVQLGQGEWLKGLASIQGILRNNMFDLDGFGSTLTGVYYNDNLICQPGLSGIQSMVNAPMSVKVSGKTLSIYNVGTAGMLSLYTADGSLIGRYELSGTDIAITLPHTGAYILSAGGYSQKIYTP